MRIAIAGESDGYRLYSGGRGSLPIPGLSEGLSGVGYTLLRCAAPGSLPRVLDFDFRFPLKCND